MKPLVIVSRMEKLGWVINEDKWIKFDSNGNKIGQYGDDLWKTDFEESNY